LLHFYIRFIGEKILDDESEIAMGELKLLNFTEVFRVPLSYWKKDNYEQQWKEGVKRILRGCNRSCLVTSMYNPDVANFIVWWPMYLCGDKVFIQNHLLFMNDLKQPFQEHNLYEHIPAREIYSIEGDKISEWSLDIRDIAMFFDSI